MMLVFTIRYHHAYFDNYFPNIKLMMDLLKDGVYGCGTLRTNRVGFPKDLKQTVKKGMKTRGESVIQQCKASKELNISLWQDNRTVIVVSTNCNPATATSVKRRLKNDTRISVPCPESIQLYNTFMGGVDLNDQLRGYYSVRLKGRKCYKYLWWFLFDIAITNAYILSKHYSNLTIPSVKMFRTELAKQLIGNFNN